MYEISNFIQKKYAFDLENGFPMNFKKNVFSYIGFGLLAIITLLGMGEVIFLLTVKLGVSIFYAFLYAFLSALLAVGAAFGLRKLVLLLCEKNIISLTRKSVILEMVLPLIFVVVGIGLRLYCIWEGGTENAVFQYASVSTSYNYMGPVHGLTYIYTRFLHLIMLFLGNNVIYSLYLQLLIQVISYLLIYFSVKKIAGKVTGIVTLGFLSFSPDMIYSAVSLEPAIFGILIFAVILYMATFLFEDDAFIVLPICIGVLAGFAIYMDFISILFLLVVIGGVLTKDYDRLDEIAYMTGGAVLSFFIFVGLDALISKNAFLKILGSMVRLYSKKAGLVLPYFVSHFNFYEIIVLLILMLMGIVSFLYSDYDEKRSGFSLALFGYLIFMTFNLQNSFTDYSLVALVLFGISAAYFFNEILSPSSEEKKALEPVIVVPRRTTRQAIVDVTNTDEDLKFAALSVDENEDMPLPSTKPAIRRVPSEASKMVDAVKNSNIENIPVKVLAEEPSINENKNTNENADMAKTVVVEEKPVQKPVQFLHNPLPLPKKHEKKKIDFDIIPRGKMNDYDIDVPVDDDFDID